MDYLERWPANVLCCCLDLCVHESWQVAGQMIGTLPVVYSGESGETLSLTWLTYPFMCVVSQYSSV